MTHLQQVKKQIITGIHTQHTRKQVFIVSLVWTQDTDWNISDPVLESFGKKVFSFTISVVLEPIFFGCAKLFCKGKQVEAVNVFAG